MSLRLQPRLPSLSRRLRARLSVELLESRTVPSAYNPAQIRHAYGDNAMWRGFAAIAVLAAITGAVAVRTTLKQSQIMRLRLLLGVLRSLPQDPFCPSMTFVNQHLAYFQAIMSKSRG